MKYIIFLLSMIFSRAIFGQSCEGYFPMKKDAVMEMTTYNEKGKPQSICTTTIQKVEVKDDDVKLDMHAEVVDEKSKPMSTVDYTARCSKGSFYINMKSMVPSEQMKAWKDMTVTMEAEDLDYPIDPSPGQKLKDAHLKVDVSTSGMNMPGMTIDITNRVVEGKESITTPAGTFECIKVTATAKFKYIIGYEVRTVEWISKGNGVVRSESYKGDKLKGYTLLTKLSK